MPDLWSVLIPLGGFLVATSATVDCWKRGWPTRTGFMAALAALNLVVLLMVVAGVGT